MGAQAATITQQSIVRWALAPSLFFVAAALVLRGETVARGWVGLYPVDEVTVGGSMVRVAVHDQAAFVRDAPTEVDSEAMTAGDFSAPWDKPADGRWSVELDPLAFD